LYVIIEHLFKKPVKLGWGGGRLELKFASRTRGAESGVGHTGFRAGETVRGWSKSSCSRSDNQKNARDILSHAGGGNRTSMTLVYGGGGVRMEKKMPCLDSRTLPKKLRSR